MFVTVWLGILEISTGKLTSASAGHEYPMINVNGKYEFLKDKHWLAIGAMPNSKYKDTEITLNKGDSVFVYTDGVAEATDANNELLFEMNGKSGGFFPDAKKMPMTRATGAIAKSAIRFGIFLNAPTI